MKFLLLTLGLLLVLNPCKASGQKPLRVLVDASKDAGLWWFPQGAALFVRAQHANDEWGPWSSIRRFNVMPMTRRSN